MFIKKIKSYFGYIFSLFIIISLNKIHSYDISQNNDVIIPFASIEENKKRYTEVEKEVEYRFNKYYNNDFFSFWTRNKTDEEINEEFLNLNLSRRQIWFDTSQKDIERSWRQDFRPVLEIARKGGVRSPHCLPFDFNQACSYYNGSIITLDGLRFLALEGPFETTIQQFFYVILDFNVPLLVRLTPDKENGKDKCAAYWNNRVHNSQIAIPRDPRDRKPKYINYLATDNWEDHSALNADLLLEMVLEAKKLYNPSEGPLAVHCSGGVGRTGTFITAFCLVTEIDKQINSGVRINDLQISIENIVVRLSLQRYNMVAHSCQYLNLYQLVEKYCSLLKEN